MNIEALGVFLIILLGLVFCFFLGAREKEGFTESEKSNSGRKKKSHKNKTHDYHKKSKYDNYNHYKKTSNALINGTTFYGPNGGQVVVSADGHGIQTLNVTLTKDQSPMMFTSSSHSQASEGYTNYDSDSDSDSNSDYSSKTFYGPNGASAQVITDDGKTEIQVNTGSGSYVYTLTESYNNPDSTTSTQYYGSTGYSVQPSPYTLSYQGPYGGSATVTATPPESGNMNMGMDTSAYSSALPPGIPKSQIPPGQEDLYILKSEIVPPVCPACPVSQASCPRQEKCPPCPACARCPEPAFECKKVPNYNAINNEYLPAPIVNDFSQFGM